MLGKGKRKEYGDDLTKAVYEASKGRFRAVILTTVTTVAGLIPIAHPRVSYLLSFGSNTDSDPFIQPMALSFAWGLFFASLVTLFFIPCNYLVFERIKEKVSGWFNKDDPELQVSKKDEDDAVKA